LSIITPIDSVCNIFTDLAHALAYPFMQKALIVSVAVSIILACIGVVIVLRRMSILGETLSHNALAGVTLGLVLGLNPILTALIISVAAVLLIEVLRRAMPRYAEISTSIILSAGLGVAAVASAFVRGYSNFEGFLFGSPIAISTLEFWLTLGLSALVIVMSIVLYKELFYITLDEEAAKLAGIPVSGINFVFMLLTAFTISVACRTVGALIVAGLLVIPVACAMHLSHSYKQTMILSIVFSVSFSVVGLLLSYELNIPTGGTIILLGVVVLFVILIVKQAVRRR